VLLPPDDPELLPPELELLPPELELLLPPQQKSSHVASLLQLDLS